MVGSFALASLSLICSGSLPDQPEEVTAYHRTHFGTVEITGYNNPFTDLKMAAKFTHAALGVTLVMPVVVQSISGGTGYMPVYFTAPFEGGWTWHLDCTTGGNTNLFDLTNEPSSVFGEHQEYVIYIR